VTLNELQVLLDYNYWARDRVLDAAALVSPEQYTRDLGSSFHSIRNTLVHMFSAEWIWHSRWQGISPTSALNVDDYPDVATLRLAWSDVERKTRTLVAELGEPGLDNVIEYKLLSGRSGASVFWQMVQHVVNHGSYHRGQVTTMLRQLGAQPPRSMDLITFYREQEG
jgi:uncharacterized damage-inducible protein DinB